MSLHREHAAKCRALAEGASDVLAATLLQMAADLEEQADTHERGARAGLIERQSEQRRAG